mgnify:CR=1 FL=1
MYDTFFYGPLAIYAFDRMAGSTIMCGFYAKPVGDFSSPADSVRRS